MLSPEMSVVVACEGVSWLLNGWKCSTNPHTFTHSRGSTPSFPYLKLVLSVSFAKLELEILRPL